MIQDVKPEQTFWLKGGKGIKNIAELGRELKEMNEETFKHHVNENKNDFANWTKTCIKDEKLTTLLKTTKNKERTAAIVERRIQELTTAQIKPPQKELPKKEQEQTGYQPTIIRTKNITQLAFKPTIIKTENTTKLRLAPIQEIIKTPHKTQLHLSTNKPEVYVHEIKPHHYSITLLASHIILGIVVGVALAILVLATG